MRGGPMKQSIVGRLEIVFFCLLTITLFAQYAVKNGVFGNGGSVVCNPDNQLHGTIGQPAIGVTQNSSYSNQIGFWHQVGGLVTHVEKISNILPVKFQLEQNYPNPFNSTTTIRFTLPKSSHVTLKLFDMMGREVASLVDETLPAGDYKVDFDAKGLASRIYFYRIQAEGFVQTRKLTLLK